MGVLQMRIPKTVEILGVEYQVRLKWNLNMDGVRLLGLCDRESKEILIDKSIVDAAEKTDTFLHECLHGVLYESGATNLIDNRTEELIVDVCARFMAKNFKVSILRKKDKIES